MTIIFKRTLPFFLAYLLALGEAYATSYGTIGIVSRIGVAGDLVYFVQADGSLTILDIRDGSVIERLKTKSTDSVGVDEVPLPQVNDLLTSAGLHGAVPSSVTEPTTGFIPRFFTSYSEFKDHRNLKVNLGEGFLRTYPLNAHQSSYYFGQVFEYGHAQGLKWRGYFPAFSFRPAELVAVTESAHHVLLGFDIGIVVCLDRESGQTQWTYIFPYRHNGYHTISLKAGEPSGMTLLPVTGDYAPTVTNTRAEARLIDDLMASQKPQSAPVIIDPIPPPPSVGSAAEVWFVLVATLLLVVLLERRVRRWSMRPDLES